MTLLLTVEGLLFVSLSLAVAGSRRELGQAKTRKPFILALASVAIIALAAAGAMSAWWSIYKAAPGSTESATLELQGIAIACAIVAQPILALGVALFARPGT